jgi:N-alpha-acetyltransferase 40
VALPSHASLPSTTASALFELTSANMAALYERAGFGWDPAAKKRELSDPAARFLLAYHRSDMPTDDAALPPSAPPVAFVHYRLEMEPPSLPTLYIYEIQASPAVRRQGLGKFLMLALELAARKGGVAQLMLTVQAGNEGAERLYAGLGFVTDPSSPGPGEGPGGRDPGYTILSKALPPVVTPGGGGGGVSRKADAAAVVVV